MYSIYNTNAFYKELDKTFRLHLKLSKLRSYKDAPEFDYQKFVECLQNDKELYKSSAGYYSFLQVIAKKNEAMIEEKASQLLSSAINKKELDVFKYSCYKSLKSEISDELSHSVNSSKKELVSDKKTKSYGDGICNALEIFKNCTIQEKSKNKESKTFEK